MTGLRLRDLLAAVVALAVSFAVAREDWPCTPVVPVLALLYVCAGLGVLAARWSGRGWRRGVLLGFCLGPVGVLVALSNPLEDPDDWPPGRKAAAGGVSGSRVAG